MGFLQGKKILITGMISERSIAYGIAKACHEQGAELAFTYVVDKLEERVRKMAKELGSDLVFRCDVQSDEEIEQAFAAAPLTILEKKEEAGWLAYAARLNG